MRNELYASAGLHVALMLWLAFGDALTRTSDPEEFEATGVTLISSAEFDALTEPVVAPIAEDPPAPEPEPEQEPVPEPELEPEPQPAPEPEPEPQAPAEPPAEVAPPPQPSLGDPTADVSDTPTPEDAPRVAPTPSPEPPPEAEIAPDRVEQPETSEPAAEAEPAEPETAPEEATTQLLTEADEASAAPVASIRPQTRPSRPEPVEVASEPAPEPEPEIDPIEAALQEALDSTEEPAAAAPVNLGPALGQETIAGFERQVGDCWNLGASGTEVLESVIVVYFELERDGRPILDTIRLQETLQGTRDGASRAFEAARSAIYRCGALQNEGFDLPEESYERWRRVEAVFNPEGMRLR